MRALCPVVDPNPRPTKDDMPVATFARFTRDPTRHLIYHIHPHKRSDNWRWNVRQLIERIEIFDGTRSIGVATDAETCTLEDVQEAFGDVRIDQWFESANQPLIGEPGNVMSDDQASALLGEGLSFIPLLHTLPRGVDDVTFYGHAKGTRYADGHLALRWAEMLYRGCLDNLWAVDIELRSFPMTGCLKRYEDFDLPRNWHWHYSGTFFWFRNADVFENPNWCRLHPAMYGQVEAWPAGMFAANMVGCLFGKGVGDLYTEAEVARLETEVDRFAPVRPPANGVSDASFFLQEVDRGLTTELWPRLLEMHRGLALAIRALGCRSVLELGSGLGPFLLGAAAVGLDAIGIDRNRQARDFALSKGVDSESYILADIASVRLEPRDCIVCVEVFEHISDAGLDSICRQLAANCHWFYFTSTPHRDPSDAEWGHVNLKSREGWIEFFEGHGLRCPTSQR